MIRRIALLALMAGITAVLVYASPWWPFEWWTRGGMLGLPPGGDLVGEWLRGTAWAPFDLIAWGIASILLLTALRKMLER